VNIDDRSRQILNYFNGFTSNMIHEIKCGEAFANKMKLYPETPQVIFVMLIWYSLA